MILHSLVEGNSINSTSRMCGCSKITVLRLGSRRFTRLTKAFPKKIENHAHAIALHYFYYNFCRKHQTIKTTPAVAMGVADRAFTNRDLVEMIEREEARTGGRLTNYLASA